MPGPYAHLALVTELERAGRFAAVLASLGITPSHEDDLFESSLLGAVSPDYPNLAPAGSDEAVWADAMHTSRTGEVAVRGVDALRLMPDDRGRQRALAWLLGYCSHLVADATIHPVVRLKVGDYETNVFAHRLCELHQDYCIAPRLGIGPIGASPGPNSFLYGCADAGGRRQMYMPLARFWSDLLLDTHLDLFQEHTPHIHSWHCNALDMADSAYNDGSHIFPLAGVILARNGLQYPVATGADPEYVDRLPVPGDETMSYGEIFGRAVANTAKAWDIVIAGVRGDDGYRSWFGDWNLDTGCDNEGGLVFWK